MSDRTNNPEEHSDAGTVMKGLGILMLLITCFAILLMIFLDRSFDWKSLIATAIPALFGMCVIFDKWRDGILSLASMAPNWISGYKKPDAKA